MNTQQKFSIGNRIEFDYKPDCKIRYVAFTGLDLNTLYGVIHNVMWYMNAANHTQQFMYETVIYNKKDDTQRFPFRMELKEKYLDIKPYSFINIPKIIITDYDSLIPPELYEDKGYTKP